VASLETPAYCRAENAEEWESEELLRVEFRPSRQLRTHSTWQYQNVAVRFCAGGGRVCLRRVKINHPPLTDCAVAALYTVYQKTTLTLHAITSTHVD